MVLSKCIIYRPLYENLTKSERQISATKSQLIQENDFIHCFGPLLMVAERLCCSGKMYENAHGPI